MSIGVRLLKTVRFFGVDRAVGYTLISRGFQIVAGMGSLLFIARFLTPVAQGFYYTFASILSLQVFFELGLTFVVMQFASHEKAHLTWTERGTLRGDPFAKARLRSLLRLASIWYVVAAALMIACVLPAGLVFFNRSVDAQAVGAWQWPWTWLVLTTAGSLVISAIMATLEGCGLVAEVARTRLAQDLLGYPIFWLVLSLGGSLFASPFGQTTRLLVAIVWLIWRKRAFLTDLAASQPVKASLNWWTEVWPMQWRIAISWVSGYLIFQLFNPVLFAFYGATAAGQMGMSLSITGAISTLAMAWMTTKSPTFGQLVARRKFQELDRIFFPSLRQVLGVTVLGGTVFWGGILVLRLYHIPLAGRVLEPLPLGLLVLATIVNVVIFSEASYLRAHKQEPFLWNSVVSGVTVGLSTYFLGRYFGALGMTAGYFALSALVGFGWATWIFLAKRKEWHQEERAIRNA